MNRKDARGARDITNNRSRLGRVQPGAHDQAAIALPCDPSVLAVNYFFCCACCLRILAQVSRRVTIRLKIGASTVESVSGAK